MDIKKSAEVAAFEFERERSYLTDLIQKRIFFFEELGLKFDDRLYSFFINISGISSGALAIIISLTDDHSPLILMAFFSFLLSLISAIILCYVSVPQHIAILKVRREHEISHFKKARDKAVEIYRDALKGKVNMQEIEAYFKMKEDKTVETFSPDITRMGLIVEICHKLILPFFLLGLILLTIVVIQKFTSSLSTSQGLHKIYYRDNKYFR